MAKKLLVARIDMLKPSRSRHRPTPAIVPRLTVLRAPESGADGPYADRV